MRGTGPDITAIRLSDLANLLTNRQIALNNGKSLDGEIGRHKGLKIPRFKRHAGSIPAPGTMSTKTTAKALYVYALQENSMSYKEIVSQIRELLGRNLSPLEISKRLHLDVMQVKNIITSIRT